MTGAPIDAQIRVMEHVMIHRDPTGFLARSLAATLAGISEPRPPNVAAEVTRLFCASPVGQPRDLGCYDDEETEATG